MPYSFFRFYSTKDIENTRSNFVKNLSSYLKVNNKCGQFYANLVENVLKNRPYELTIRRELHINKVFKDGDVSICKQVLKECFTSLHSINLNERKKALTIINDFVKWGDILVAYAVNYLGVVDDLIKEIADPHERMTGTGRAKALLFKYGNTLDEKIGYYN